MVIQMNLAADPQTALPPMAIGRRPSVRRPILGAAYREEAARAVDGPVATPAVEMTFDQYTTLLNAIHDAVILRTIDGRITFWNRGASDTYGWSRDAAAHVNADTLLRTRYPHSAAEVREALIGTGHWEGVLVQTVMRGAEIIVTSHQAVIRDGSGNPIAIVEINRDITSQVRDEEEIAHTALYNPVTDLPRRVLFLDHVRHATERAKRRGAYGFAVLVLDIADAAALAGRHGQQIADELIRGIAGTIERCVRGSDVLAHIDTHRFAILLDDARDIEDAERVAERVRIALLAPILVGDHHFVVRVEIGAALGGERNAENVLDAAERIVRTGPVKDAINSGILD